MLFLSCTKKLPSKIFKKHKKLPNASKKCSKQVGKKREIERKMGLITMFFIFKTLIYTIKKNIFHFFQQMTICNEKFCIFVKRLVTNLKKDETVFTSWNATYGIHINGIVLSNASAVLLCS